MASVRQGPAGLSAVRASGNQAVGVTEICLESIESHPKLAVTILSCDGR